jgi:hypothetical protein
MRVPLGMVGDWAGTGRGGRNCHSGKSNLASRDCQPLAMT